MVLSRAPAFVFVFLVAGGAYAQSEPERALQLHDEASALYAKGKYNDAIEKLKLAVELDPDEVVLYFNLGKIEEKLGHIDTAIAYYRRCLELASNPEEKLRMAKTVKRLEGAKKYVSWGDNAQTAPVILRESTGQTTSQGSTQLLPWAYVTGAFSVVSLVVGASLAAKAGDLDPGDAPTTNAGSTPETLQADADAAHDFAIGADVAFGMTGVGVAATVTIALMSAHGIGGKLSDDQTLSVGPTGARWTWNF